MDEAYRVARPLVDSTDAAYFEGLGNLAHAVLGADDVREEFAPPRSYLACKWSYSASDEPTVILSELDAARCEVRKIHQFADGRLERADRITEASISLSWEPTPSEADIAANDEFELVDVDAATFEETWRQAVPVGLPVLVIDGASSTTSMASWSDSRRSLRNSSGMAASTPSTTYFGAGAELRTVGSSCVG